MILGLARETAFKHARNLVLKQMCKLLEHFYTIAFL